MESRLTASTKGSERTLAYTLVALSLLMLYFPWGAALRTGIAIPSHLGWALIGLTLLVMACRMQLTFYRPRLPLFGVALLILPVLWMPSDADTVAGLSRVATLLLGALLLSLLGGMSPSETQARQMGRAFMLLAAVCALSVVVRRFLPAAHALWMPLAGGGWSTGGFLQPDLMATFLAAMLLVAVHLWLLRGRWQDLCFVTLLMFSLALCQSVMGWFGGIIGLLLMIFACARGYRRRLAGAMGVIFVAGLAGAGWQIFGLAQPLCYPFPLLSLAQTYQASEALLSQYPLSGIGYGRFESLFPEGVALAGIQGDYHLHGVVTHAGLEGLHWVVEGGVIAAIGVIALFVWGMQFFGRLWRQGSRVGGYGHEGSDALGWGISTLPLLLSTMVGAPWYQSPLHLLLFLLLAGITIARLPKLENQFIAITSPAWTLRAVIAFIGLVTMGYSLTGTAVAVGVQAARQVRAQDIRLMETAVRFNPWYMRDAVGFARSLHQLQQYKKTNDTTNLAMGITGLQHYVISHPDPNAYSLLITALDRQGKTQEAEAMYMQAQQRMPWDARFSVK